MQSLEREVQTAINSIHDELVATGTEGPAPQQPATTSGQLPDRPPEENIPSRDRSRTKELKNTTEGEEKRREEDRSSVARKDSAICGQNVGKEFGVCPLSC